VEKRVLGRSGLWVSVLGLGTGTFGAFGDATEDECIRMAHCALDGGVTLVDTADFYSFGESETIVGKALKGRRDRLVLATKVGMPMSDDPNEKGGSRRWITAAVERSLKRLQTDYIDLYQLHQPDPNTAIEETLGAMTDLVRAGKVRCFGVSNSTAAMVIEAGFTAAARDLIAPHSEQTAFSIFERRPEAELLPACEKFGMGFLAYSPLEGGWLSGRYRRGAPSYASARQRFRPVHFDVEAEQNSAMLDAVEALVAIAQDAGMSLSELAMGFVLSHRAVTCALAGASRLEQLQANIAATERRLSDAILDRIDDVVAPGRSLTGVERATPAMQDKALRRRPQPAQAGSDAPGEAIRRMFDKREDPPAPP
jgi:aryl-alcohol dehydrogenase (NADP+)